MVTPLPRHNDAISRMITVKPVLLAMLLIVHLVGPSGAWASVSERLPVTVEWWGETEHAGPTVNLFFFWSVHCPHCTRARPFIESLGQRHPWLRVYSLELTAHPQHRLLYTRMARAFGEEPVSVPAFFWCGVMSTGYDDAETTGAGLEASIADCHRHLTAAGSLDDWEPFRPRIDLPLVGSVDPASMSLPLLTLVLAGLDSFNPCAFFVLLFLLSLLVHAHSRRRILLIGGTFVLVSGLVYFLFMATWLNLFLLIGQVDWITLAAGLLAVAVALINIKDFFRFRQGVTLSIPDSAKPRLFERMRGLLRAESLPTLLAGTLALALLANTYELLCTVGFPMVYTRALSLQELPSGTYYAYLALYNLVYVVPLMLIVGLFAFTLGSRKLSEREGRTLKLLSGLMMLQLGMVLVLRPQWLNELGIAVALLLIAALGTWLITRLSRPAS